jgi:hypothetical protein
MKKTEKQTAVLYNDVQGQRWVTLQDAARIVGIPDKTLYAAVYRGGTGRRPTIPHIYIKEHPKQHRGTLYVPFNAVIEYRAEEIVKDAQKVETELKAVLQQYGITREEADAIMNSYEKAFERVIGEVRAKELQGILANEQPITV